MDWFSPVHFLFLKAQPRGGRSRHTNFIPSKIYFIFGTIYVYKAMLLRYTVFNEWVTNRHSTKGGPALEDLIIEVIDQLDARGPKNIEQLEDMMSEELDKHPELADTETADWVKEIIREYFNF